MSPALVHAGGLLLAVLGVGLSLIVSCRAADAFVEESNVIESYEDPNWNSATDNETTRINGGQLVTEEVPYQVSLQMHRRGGVWKHFCGGAIIGPEHVLTAAHCLHKLSTKAMVVVAGTIDWRSGGARHRIVAKDIHPGFSMQAAITNDIAVLKVAPAFDLTKRTVGAIPLGAANRIGGRVAVRLTGWGSTTPTYNATSVPQQLHMLDYQTITNEQCRRRGFRVTGQELCALAGKGRGACVGDSGGPLVTRAARQPPQLVGIVSYGTPTCAQGRPDVYSRVSSYLPYINKAITTKIP